MLINNIIYPNQLVQAIKNNNLVVFVGAGVSMNPPTNLPNFTSLVNHLSKDTKYVYDDSEAHDVFLGKMEYNQIDIRGKASCFFLEKDALPNDLHRSILNLFKEPECIRVVTTNYEYTIEKAVENSLKIKTYSAPALPLGNDFTGIVHLHGEAKEPKTMILTDSDFGFAYLLEGYATRFLSRLFSEYTVLFIGYSYNDVVMNYLSRALPSMHSKQRYILTDDNERQWKLLGLEPIFYPKTDYNKLIESLSYLGKRVHRDMIEWKIKCGLYASTIPPIDEEAKDEVYEIFNHEIYLELFIEQFNYENFDEWFEWIRLHSYLDVIELQGPNNKNDTLLCVWLIQTDLNRNQFGNFLKLFSDRNMKIGDMFINELFSILAYSQNVVETDALKKLLIMFNDKIQYQDRYILVNIMNKCNNQGIVSYSLDIFIRLLNPVFFLEKRFSIDENNHEYDGKYKFGNDTYLLQKPWDEYLNKNLPDFYNELYFILKNLFDKIQLFSEDFNKNTYDFVSLFVDIENEIKSKDMKNTEMFICKLMYNILEYIDKCSKQEYRKCINELVSAHSITSRKIALLSIKDSTCLNPNEKYKIIDKFTLYERNYKTELFRLIAKIYSGTSPTYKSRIMRKLTRGIVKNPNDKFDNYQVYNWFVWLLRHHKDDSYILSEYKKYESLFEGYGPRDEPELSVSSMKYGFVNDESPLSRDQIDHMTPQGIVQFVDSLNDQPESFNKDNSKRPLLDLLYEKANTDLNWRIEMIKHLKDRQNLSSDLWDYLIKDIGETRLQESQAIFLIYDIINRELIQEHGIIIADFISDIVLNKELDKEFFLRCEDQILYIIDLLFETPQHNIKVHESFVMIAINGTSANAAQAVLNMLLKNDEDKGIPEKYKNLFLKFTDPKYPEALNFICFIVGYYRILYLRDNEWTATYLLSKLTNDEKDVFNAAWEGMLTLTPTIYADDVEDLLFAYEHALNKIDLFIADVRRQFVESYGVLLMYVLDNPNAKLAKILDVLNDDDRLILFKKFVRILKNMDDNDLNVKWEKWLLTFFVNVKSNIPIAFSDDEIVHLLKLLNYPGDYYNKIVESVVNFKSIKFKTSSDLGSLLNNLNETNNTPINSNSNIKLLKYLLSCKFDSRRVQRQFKKFYSNIVFEDQKMKNDILNLGLEMSIHFE